MSQPKNSSPQNPASQSSSRYQKIRKLGSSDRGHRFTYLAKDNKTQKTAVIKQYVFGNSQSDWAGLKAYEPYAKVLLNLKHPSIPRYLNFFPSKDGFCAVREFKQATSLAAFRHLNLEVVHKIAISLLKTLIYLQNQSPFVIHYNIKPENILVDDCLNVYLVDFGFPYINQKGKIQASFAGTPGFMPREQLHNKDLTEASDVYAIGATLVCLVTQTSSHKIEDLLSPDSRVSLVKIIPKDINFKFVEWLEGLLKPSPYQRYSNGENALEALNQVDLKRSPQAKIKPDAIELKSTKYGEKLIAKVSVTNTVPDTLLQGKWELVDRGDDRISSSSRFSWLVFDPPHFEGNRISCDVMIDTKKLQEEQVYERQIILHTNDEEKKHAIDLKIETAPLAIEKLPWLHLAGLTILGLLGGSFLGILFANTFANYAGFLMGLILGGICGVAGIFHNYDLPKKILGIVVVFGVLPWNLFLRLSGVYLYSRFSLIMATLIGLSIFSAAGYILRYSYGQPIQSKEPRVLKEILSIKGLIPLFIATFGIFLGIGSNTGNLLIFLALILTGVPVGIMLYRFHVRQAKILANYRQIESHLLKP